MYISTELIEGFQTLQRIYPALFAKAEILTSGTNLIVDHKDGTVSKIIATPPLETPEELLPENLETEIANLKALEQIQFSRFEIPKLVGDIEALPDSDFFFASYRMTKIIGHSASWAEGNLALFPDIRNHFREAGQVVAEFHAGLASLTHEWCLTHNRWRGGKILSVPELDDDVNEALARADAYFQKGRQTKIIHGDIHGANFMLDKDRHITSLVDFNMIGRSDNYLSEFSYITPEFLEDFLQGYQEVSGEYIDPDMLRLSLLNEYTSRIKFIDETGEDIDDLTPELKKSLRELSHITGYRTPAP